MSITVTRIDTGRDLREFLKLPALVYRNDPFWVPQLHSETRKALDDVNNPYFRTASCALFLARRDMHPIARVAVSINHAYRAILSDVPALFGFFDALDDQEAVAALFAEARRWARSRGAQRLVGPFHPHHYSEVGLQLSGFQDRPTFFQTHNPPGYRTVLEACGFTIQQRVYSTRNGSIQSFLRNHPAVPIRTNGLSLRRVDYRHLDEDMERIRFVYNDAFEGHPYFIPVSRDEYRYASASFKAITRPDLNVIVEHHGEPVGALQCVLDVNPLLSHCRSGSLGPWNAIRFLNGRRHVSRLVVFAVGIRRAWQRTRVHALLFNALHEMAQGFDELESTWVSPANPMAIMAAERFGMLPDKEFALFETPLSQTLS